MKIEVKQLDSDYTASWWFDGLHNVVAEIEEWIETREFCPHHGGRIYVMCNGGSCND